MAEEKDTNVDEDGLVIQTYQSTMLVVLPPEGFGDQILRYVRSSLYNIHVGTRSVSTVVDDMITGRLQDEFMVDGPLSEADMADYSGIIVAGSEGESSLADDASLHQLLRDADSSGKLIATWGNGLAALARAGVLRGRRVTGDEACAEEARKAGARYHGRQVVSSGNVVTARDEGAGMRMGQELVEHVRISDAEERWGVPQASSKKLLFGLGVLAVLVILAGVAVVNIVVGAAEHS